MCLAEHNDFPQTPLVMTRLKEVTALQGLVALVIRSWYPAVPFVSTLLQLCHSDRPFGLSNTFAFGYFFMFPSQFPQVRCETALGRIKVLLSGPLKGTKFGAQPNCSGPTDGPANILPCNNHNLFILHSDKPFRFQSCWLSDFLNSGQLLPPVFNLCAKLSKQAASSLASIFAANIWLEMDLNVFPQNCRTLASI